MFQIDRFRNFSIENPCDGDGGDDDDGDDYDGGGDDDDYGYEND